MDAGHGAVFNVHTNFSPMSKEKYIQALTYLLTTKLKPRACHLRHIFSGFGLRLKVRNCVESTAEAAASTTSTRGRYNNIRGIEMSKHSLWGEDMKYWRKNRTFLRPYGQLFGSVKALQRKEKNTKRIEFIPPFFSREAHCSNPSGPLFNYHKITQKLSRAKRIFRLSKLGVFTGNIPRHHLELIREKGAFLRNE